MNHFDPNHQTFPLHQIVSLLEATSDKYTVGAYGEESTLVKWVDGQEPQVVCFISANDVAEVYELVNK